VERRQHSKHYKIVGTTKTYCFAHLFRFRVASVLDKGSVSLLVFDPCSEPS